MNNNSKPESTVQGVDKPTKAPLPYVISPELHGQLHRLYNALAELAGPEADIDILHAFEGALAPLCEMNAELARLCPAGNSRSIRLFRCEDFARAWLVSTNKVTTAGWDSEEVAEMRPVVTWHPLPA